MKLYKITAGLFVMIFCSAVLSAAPSRELNKTALEEIKSSLQMDGTTRALINAVTNNDIKSLVLNRERVNKNNEVYNFLESVSNNFSLIFPFVAFM